jgi:hypothetical protein
MKLEYGIIVSVGVLALISMSLIANNPNEFVSYSNLEQMNQKAVEAKEAKNQNSLDEYRSKMKKQLQSVTSSILGVNIDSIYLKDDWNFPFRDSAEVKPTLEEYKKTPICNILPNLSFHLQNIRETEFFSMYGDKYQNYSIELDIADERYHNSTVHYGFTAKSGNHHATTFFHVDSCTNQVTNSERYFLSCYNDTTHKIFGTINKDDILASLNHPDFCTIPLDLWRQSMYDYNQKIHEQQTKHFQTIEVIEQNHESLSAWDLEHRRFGLLRDISNMYVMAIDNEQDIEDKINQYNTMFGSLPEEFLQILEARK